MRQRRKERQAGRKTKAGEATRCSIKTRGIKGSLAGRRKIARGIKGSLAGRKNKGYKR
jgi:hypothetical protein